MLVIGGMMTTFSSLSEGLKVVSMTALNPSSINIAIPMATFTFQLFDGEIDVLVQERHNSRAYAQ